MGYNLSVVSKSQSIGIEFLKYFLLLQVIIGHQIGLAFPNLSELDLTNTQHLITAFFKAMFSLGRESAYIFIFISGFFSSKIFLDEEFHFYSALKKRILRIYPIFVITLVFTLIMDWLGIFYFDFAVYYYNNIKIDVISNFNMKNFLLNFLSLQPTFTNSFGSNTPLWTLGYLVQFYVLTCLFKHFNCKLKLSNYIKFVVFFPLCILTNFEFVLLYLVWLSGVYSNKLNLKFLSKSFLQNFLLFLLIIIIQKISNKFLSIILTPLASVIVLHCLKQLPSFIKRKIKNMNRFPDISYILYALHMPILFFILGFFNSYTEDSLSNDFFFVILSLLISFVLSIITLKINSLFKLN